MRLSLGVCALALAAGLVPGLAGAEQIVGLTTTNTLVSFDSATPGTILSTRAITGLGSDVLTGIDLRPATQGLYSLGTSGNLYRLDRTGATYSANLVGNIGSGITASGFGLDFNPVVDRLRFVSDVDQNLRIVPDTAVLITDTPISGGLDLVGSAYANNFSGALATTLYGLDAAGDQLVFATVPNNGVYAALGPLGVALSASDRVGFDISGLTGGAFFNRGSEFYSLNLGTGAATLIGSVGSGQLVGLTAVTPGIPEPSTWVLTIGGFGLAGLALRSRRRARPVRA